MKIQSRFLRLPAAVCVVLLVATVALAQTPTRLQVASTKYQDRAGELATKIDALGYGPAAVQNDGGTLKVVTRVFPSHAEASFVKPALAGAGFHDAFCVAETEEDSQTAVFSDIPSVTQGARFTGLQLDFHPKPAPATPRPALTEELKALDNNAASKADLFRKAMAFRLRSQADDALAAFEAFIQRFSNSSNAAKAKLMRGYWLIEKGEDAAAKHQFEIVADEHAGRPEAGEAQLRVGYLLIRANAPEGETLQQFLTVAKGDVAATDEVRCEAMLRCAALYHRGKDLKTAEAAYRHIEQFADGDPEVQAFAKMQRAGIAMEKAWNGKATFAQARQACDELLAQHPEVNKQTRATAALMAMETLCYEKTFAPVLERGSAFLAEFNDTPEAPLAYYWIAKARMETGDNAGAAQLLDAVIEADFDTKSRFKHADIAPAARRLATKVHEKLGNPEKAQAILATQ
jgi:TolA-binding protein